MTNVVLSEGLTSLTDWFVRTRLRVDNGRAVAWSAATPFTTLDARGDESPVDYGRLDSDVKGLVNWMTDDRREIIRQAQENATGTADDALKGFANVLRLSQQLTSTFGSAKAQWKQDIFVATGPNSAIGQQLTEINAQLFTDDGASVIDLMQARVDGVEGDVTAISNALTEVNASVDGTVANAAWRMTAQAGSSGNSVKISAFGRLGIGDTWKQAGWFVNVTPTGSQFIVVANQFAIADPNNDGSYTYPFVVQNGEVYIQNARLGTLKFDILQANNGKMVLRGYDNFADIRIVF